MKSFVVLFLAFLILAPAAQSQTKVVHFKKLQEYLPSMEMKGFERKKPTGQTQTAMGMTSSEAKVRYVTQAPPDSVPASAFASRDALQVPRATLGGVPKNAPVPDQVGNTLAERDPFPVSVNAP